MHIIKADHLDHLDHLDHVDKLEPLTTLSKLITWTSWTTLDQSNTLVTLDRSQSLFYFVPQKNHSQAD